MAYAKPPKKDVPDEILLELATADFGKVYYDDGCGCGTLLDIGEVIENGPKLRPDPRIRAIVDLRESEIPFLIEHLDDTRPTKTLFNKTATPLGHMMLDLLSSTVMPNPKLFIPECYDNGLGACFQPGFYFRPDATPEQMKTVKKNWEALYRKNGLKFRYPPNWVAKER